MRFFTIAYVLFCASTIGAISQPPLSQKEACAKFSDAVVQIDSGGQSFGSGFIVSPDGYILTANHVVRSNDGQYFSAILVTLPGNHLEQATPVIPLSLAIVGRDYALLKVVPQSHPLPFLQLGGTEEIVTGGDATIIGFPFSALLPGERRSTAKFCLSATFAANESVTNTVDATRQTPTGRVPFHQDIQTDVVYFQGPSIKGISGSPIISRDTGRVVGIVSTRLTGISKSLSDLKDQAVATAAQGSISLMGVDPLKFNVEIVNVIDSQLANGLGSAVAIDEAKRELKKAQRAKR